MERTVRQVCVRTTIDTKHLYFLGLFTRFVDTFFRLKTLSSGFPEGVGTDEDKKRFAAQLFEHEGINIDVLAMRVNPAVRTVAKLVSKVLYLFLSKHWRFIDFE